MSDLLRVCTCCPILSQFKAIRNTRKSESQKVRYSETQIYQPSFQLHAFMETAKRQKPHRNPSELLWGGKTFFYFFTSMRHKTSSRVFFHAILRSTCVWLREKSQHRRRSTPLRADRRHRRNTCSTSPPPAPRTRLKGAPIFIDNFQY